MAKKTAWLRLRLKTGFILSLMALLSALSLGQPAFADQVDASASPPLERKLDDVLGLLRHIDELWRGRTSQAQMTMRVKTQRYERSMSLEAWSMGPERSLVVIREPKKDRGVATLKVEANIWNYLPRIDRVTKVPSSMMSGAWMGSHFTNDDLVKESTFSQDYTAEQYPFALLEKESSEELNNESSEEPNKEFGEVPSDVSSDTPSASAHGANDRPMIYIRALPKPDAHVVWGRVDIWVDARAHYPIKIEYFDEAQQRVRTLYFDQVEVIAGRSIPMRLHLQPEENPLEFTEIIYKKIAFDVPVATGFFSLQNLKNRH